MSVSEIGNYQRWVDGKPCCVNHCTCGGIITTNDACVILATHEGKRKQLFQQTKHKKGSKNKKNASSATSLDLALDWVPNGRQVLHRSCYNHIVQTGDLYFARATERALFQAAQQTVEFVDDPATVQQAARDTAHLFWYAAGNSHTIPQATTSNMEPTTDRNIKR